MRKILVPLLAVMVLGAGCSKNPQFSGTSVPTDNTAVGLSSCKVGAEDTLDPQTLAIEGQSVATTGAQVRYALNQDMGCASTEKVSWNTVGGGPSAVGVGMRSSFAKAGSYVVTAKVETIQNPVPVQVAMRTVVAGDSMAISGPQVGMVGLGLTFDLAVPASLSLASADWDFGDSSAVVSSLDPVLHAYRRAGTYTITVTGRDAGGATTTAAHSVQVIPLTDDLNCVADLSISGPSETTTGVPVTLSVFLPTCVTSHVTAVDWNFGDQTPDGNNQTVTHTFSNAGSYTVTVSLFNSSSNTTPWVTLTQTVHVTDPVVTPTPTPTPNPTPTPSPTPTPNPLACLQEGQTRQTQGDLYSETQACGVNGTKVMSYRDVITERCQNTADGLLWTQVSDDKTLQSEGPCQGQACAVPASAAAEVNGAGLLLIGGQYYMADGTTKTFYTTNAPDGSCQAVSQTRSCSNGVLSGSTGASHLSCSNGCEGFGPNGTVKTGVVTGTTQVAKTCQFGETGVFDLFNQVSDQACQAGQVVTSNTHQGDLNTAGVCPTYQWTATDGWSACSADCGGTQTQIFACHDDKGAAAPSERCAGSAPTVSRVCDGNPAAVAHSESSTSTESADSSALCPANQIGVIVNERDVTTTQNYACIDHSVQLAGTTTQNGPWVAESYCRDYVPHRCSQDSLSTPQAQGRYAWMKKCENQVPVIKEFMTKFGDVDVKDGKSEWTIDSSGRTLYPTFMNHSTRPEKPWIAPTSAAASCNVPSGVYVAAVCLSSCATPEQEILAQADAHRKLRYTSFIDALTANDGFVGTLTSNSEMSSKMVQKTKVDMWVTELLDTDHVILEFHMKSGGVLRLTPNHTVLSGYGTMQLASDFKVGDSFVRLGGELDPIVEIRNTNYFGKVYNVFVKSADPRQNIVVTNGYLNGTAFFQNEGAGNVNRELFRHQLIKGVFDK